MALYHGDTFEHGGHTFKVTLERDDHMGPPWEEHDGHGPVSDWTTRDKLPGEMILCSDGRRYRYYDFAGAVRIAKRDGWNAEPYYPPGEETRGQRAAKAALADFKRLQDWCEDRWEWVTVGVHLLDADGEETGVCDYIGGVESDAGDYLNELAAEMADGLLPAATFHPAA